MKRHTGKRSLHLLAAALVFVTTLSSVLIPATGAASSFTNKWDIEGTRSAETGKTMQLGSNASSDLFISPSPSTSSVALAAPSQGSPQPICAALDLTGSMEETTDIERYSISALNLIADLAANAVVTVFTFAGEGPSGVKLLGTFDLSDPAQSQALRQRIAEIDSKKREGNTPTAELVKAVYQHLLSQNLPSGSGCVIISDGEPAPDSEGQHQRINEMLPGFAERGWKLHAIALGNGPWVQRFLGIATQLGGVALTANNAKELLGVVLHAFNAYRSDAPPEVSTASIGADGRTAQHINVDDTIKRLAVVVTRPNSRFNVSLITPQGAQIRAGDSRLAVFNGDDRHYVIFSLTDTKSLGAGRWTVEMAGPQGEALYVAVSKQSTLRLVMTEPKAGLFMANRPAKICAQILDGERPISPTGARVKVTAVDPEGRDTTKELLDDGRPNDSGDAVANDGTFCGRLTVGPGNHRLVAEATTAGEGRAGAQGSLFAETFPGFELLRVPSSTVMRDGEVARVPIAQLGLKGGRIGNDIISRLTLLVRPPNGPERRFDLDRQAALDQNGVLTIEFATYQRDAVDQRSDKPAEGFQIPYSLIVQSEYKYRGQSVVDDAAVATKLPVKVMPWPWPCSEVPNGIRPACTAIAENELLKNIALAVSGLFFLLIILGVVLRIIGNRSSATADGW